MLPVLTIILSALTGPVLPAEQVFQNRNGTLAGWSPRAAGLVPVAGYRPPNSPVPPVGRRLRSMQGERPDRGLAIPAHPAPLVFSVPSTVVRRPSTFSRLPSQARLVPATGGPATLGAAYLPQVQLGLTVLPPATIFRALPDIPLPVFEASLYLLPTGPAAPGFTCPSTIILRRPWGFACWGFPAYRR